MMICSTILQELANVRPEADGMAGMRRKAFSIFH